VKKQIQIHLFVNLNQLEINKKILQYLCQQLLVCFFLNERLENIFVENIETSYLSRCSCQSHLATELINRTYSMSVERLFDYIFGDNDFLLVYRASRRF